MADESTPDTTTEPTTEPTTGEASGTTLALGTTAGVATLFLLLRLFAVSGWDWEAAAAIAETIDFDDALPIILGTLFAEPMLTGALLSVLVPMTLINLVWPPTVQPVKRLSRLLLPVAVFVAAVTWLLTFREAWFFLVTVLVAALVVGVRLVWRRGVGHEVVVTLFHSVGTVSVCVLLVMAVAVQTPWMSHERVETGTSSVTGYVIEDEPGFVKLLTEDRELTIIDTADVTGRELLD